MSEPSPNKTLYLMQGIPASGKTTVARAVAGAFGYSRTYSTDDFWGSNYDFKPELLGQAHDWNQANVIQAMIQGVLVIVVDNTNLSVKDMAPYCEMAAQFGYAVQLITVECPLEIAIWRNSQRRASRQVPEETIRKMYDRLRSNQQETALYVRSLNASSAD